MFIVISIMSQKKHVKLSKWKPVFNGHIFTVEEAEAELPDGGTRIYERVSRQPTIEVIAFDSKQRLLLNREYRPLKKMFAWRFPTGKVDVGETPKQAAQRELMEELGFKAKKIKLLHKNIPASSFTHVHYIYIATNLVPKKLDAGEFEDIKTIPMSLAKVYQMVQNEEINGSETMRAVCKLYWNRQEFQKWLD